MDDAPIPLMTEGKPRPESATSAATEPVVAPIAPAPASPARPHSWGGLIGIVIIVSLIITAAFYSWGERLAAQPVPVEVAE